jgi:hypothetical protein
MVASGMRWLTLLAIGAGFVACGGDDDGSTASNSSGGGGGVGGSSGDASTAATGGGISLDGGSDSSADACAATSVGATVVKKPVDLILIVDTSPTMQPASTAVENNVNQNLAQVLTTSNVDYRIIVLAGYGSGPELCVGPPLGGASCASPPATPANTSTFFHYGSSTGSGALLQNIIAWYNAPDPYGLAPTGWSAWLRADSLKVFVAISDTSSGSNMSDGQFDAQLLALSPAMFGTAAAREYVFHSIIGLNENNPPTSPWLPTDPIVTGTCTGYSGSLGSGDQVQGVSILSGGLRFPICQFGSFDVVFQAIASNVVSAVPIACDLPFPTPPTGKTIDPNTVELDFTPGGGGPVEKLIQVKSAAECTPSAFWIEGETIHLCPDACAKVNADGGSISVRFGCDVGFVP